MAGDTLTKATDRNMDKAMDTLALAVTGLEGTALGGTDLVAGIVLDRADIALGAMDLEDMDPDTGQGMALGGTSTKIVDIYLMLEAII